MKKLLIILIIISTYKVYSQSTLDTRFLQHLVNNEKYNEALFLIDKTDYRNDSVYYYQGWALYSLKNLDDATNSFLNVDIQSPFYAKSRFFAAYNCIYNSKYNESISILNSIKSENTSIAQLRNFQLSGIDLLNWKFDDAEKKWEAINPNNSVLYQPLKNIKEITNELKNHKEKSPLLAGILSAVIPGAGKFYAGKKGEGVATFISTVGLGLVTYENYNKLGVKNIKTILFGTLFTVNYASSIYGSVVTTKQIENDYQAIMQNQILFNLHIPLRNYFE